MEKFMLKNHPEFFEGDPLADAVPSMSEKMLLETVLVELRQFRSEITGSMLDALGDQRNMLGNELSNVIEQYDGANRKEIKRELERRDHEHRTMLEQIVRLNQKMFLLIVIAAAVLGAILFW
jgi:hypothetical protein